MRFLLIFILGFEFLLASSSPECIDLPKAPRGVLKEAKRTYTGTFNGIYETNIFHSDGSYSVMYSDCDQGNPSQISSNRTL